MKKNLLFLNHAKNIGGSVQSTKYLINFISKNYNVYLIQKEAPIIKKKGLKYLKFNNLRLFHHTSFKYFNTFNFLFFFHILSFVYEYLRLIIFFKKNKNLPVFDVVHINSMVLFPYCIIMRHFCKNIIFHIREYPPITYFNFRNRLIIYLCKLLKIKIIFISKSSQINWFSNKFGDVIYNPYKISNFSKNKNFLRKKKLKVLLLGAVSRVKDPLKIFKYLLKYDYLKMQIYWYGGDFTKEQNLLNKIINFFEKHFFDIAYSSKCLKAITKFKNSKIYIKKLEYNLNKIYKNQYNFTVINHDRLHFSRSVIEAIISNIFVICSNFCDGKEFIELNKNGAVFEYNNESSFDKAFSTMLKKYKFKKNYYSILKKINSDFERKILLTYNKKI